MEIVRLALLEKVFYRSRALTLTAVALLQRAAAKAEREGQDTPALVVMALEEASSGKQCRHSLSGLKKAAERLSGLSKKVIR